MNRMLPLAALALACIAAPALADEVAKIGDASVTLSAEAMVAAAAPTVSSFAVTALSGLATILLGRIGPVWLSSLLAGRIEIVVRTAVDYALNAVEGAAKGQVLTIPVGSAVVAKALQRALDSTPAWIVRLAGGPAEIGARIFRSLNLEADSTAAKVLEPALQGLGKAAR
ncbi:hypothetical protein [Methylorubrum salsuginis]|uniref:Uncharacterized protein n=1 Tax=Methylorubrum salsuginis TaxID=414703 RepID=A0A1I4FPQ9_9HYPH|nr:hypothetical protein [Methylorubrum salsuginis]SFL18937.1 hypothetical protein SAMN04488125_110114 [Methylorubrum salsuginis]